MNRLVIVAIAFLLLSCDEVSDNPRDRYFNILFRYGVGARNELNSFENTYTKDLILDGTVKIRLVLSTDDFYAIEGKLQSTGFFSFPDTLKAAVSDTPWYAIHPHSTYFFRVQTGANIKTLYCADSVYPEFFAYYRIRYEKLQEIVRFIHDRLSMKPEIQRLPPARGSYW